MAYYKKRRAHQGPNKNEEKVLRAQQAESQARRAGVLGAKFPFVKSLKMTMTFLDARQNPLDEKSVSLQPNSVAIFSASCPGRCGKGNFDLTAALDQAVTARQPNAEFSLKCPEPLYAGASEACAVELRVRLELDYLPLPVPAPQNP